MKIVFILQGKTTAMHLLLYIWDTHKYFFYEKLTPLHTDPDCIYWVDAAII